MEINADLIARHMLKMAVEIETLLIQRDTLAEEVKRLNDELDKRENSEKDSEKGV